MIETFVQRLGQHLKAVPVLLPAIQEEVFAEKPSSGKWSKKEILGHLVDSALTNLKRFTTIRFCEPPFEIIPYAQAELVTANQYQSQDVEAILSLWKTLNQQILSVWKSYTSAELAIPVIDRSSGKEGNLAWWIEDYTMHLEHHLVQIFGISFSDQKLWLTTPTEAADLLSQTEQPFVRLLEHGSMYVEYYTPEYEDLQTPHEQDELYVIDQGSGVFYNGGIRHSFDVGDVLFVPAGVEHRFEDFSEDFGTWVIFYGPKGGE